MIRMIRSIFAKHLPAAIGCAALLALILPLADGLKTAEAGSPLGELEYQYPCIVGRSAIEVRYDASYDPVAIGLDFRGSSRPMFVVNENEAFKQPVELVTFEYFSVCEQINGLMAESDPAARLQDVDWMRDTIFRADCQAMTRMRREGLLHGPEGYVTIIDVYYGERGRQSYLGVRFDERAENIRSRCPL